jgi:hypothetical protein
LQVSIPTLLSWESIAGIGKQANYAQQNDTSINEVPKHAYLTLNRDGTYAVAWRLPNTYIVNDLSIHHHSRTGKATKIKQAVSIEIAYAEQRGSIGDAALPFLENSISRKPRRKRSIPSAPVAIIYENSVDVTATSPDDDISTLASGMAFASSNPTTLSTIRRKRALVSVGSGSRTVQSLSWRVMLSAA